MVGNYYYGAGVNKTLFPGNLCVDREVGKIARGGDSEELGNDRNNFTCIFYILSPLCTVHLMKSLGKLNTTVKAVIIVYFCNYSNQCSCFMCPSPKYYQCATWEMYHYSVKQIKV